MGNWGIGTCFYMFFFTGRPAGRAGGYTGYTRWVYREKYWAGIPGIPGYTPPPSRPPPIPTPPPSLSELIVARATYSNR